MNIYLSTRNIVRLVTFGIAIVAVTIASILISYNKQISSERNLNNMYLKSIEELSVSTDNIRTTLSKGIYCGTPEQLALVSTKLLKDSAQAKQALSSLPVESSETSEINRFLSQVGNYAYSISKRTNAGEVLTLEEYMKLASLCDYADKLTDELWKLEKKVQSGMITITDTTEATKDENTPAPPTVTDGFKDFEEYTDTYPTLIYDGPFSAHILEKMPMMLKGMKDVGEKQAKKTASIFTGIQENELQRSSDEEGKMPSYCFEGDGNYIAVTKAGGFVSYMLKPRNVDDRKISIEDALSTAKAYLLNCGYKNIVTTYYETVDNICTINFAVVQDNITIYTDLIKVSVAMDNAQIIGLDARGYIVNHQDRIFPKELIPEEQAKASLSPLLTVEKVKLALIPTAGLNEVLTYEYLCTSRNKQTILVYINAQTGAEEQIFIVYKSTGSVLTM